MIDGGGGSDTIYGGGGTDTISFASATGPQVIDLGAQATWDYGINGNKLSGFNNAIGSRFDDVIMGTDAREGGSGGVLTGGGGADTFIFQSGFGHQIITDFVAGNGAGHDVVKFGYSVLASGDPLASAVDAGGNVILSVTDHDDIVLIGVRKSDLVAANFQIG